MNFGGLRSISQYRGRRSLDRCTGSGRVERRKALKEDFELLFHLLLNNILNKEDIKL